MTPAKRRLQVALLAALSIAGSAIGCATASGKASTASDASVAAPPLASMAGRPLIMLPTQFLVRDDRVIARGVDSSDSEFMRILDDEIALALRNRGVSQWTSARDLAAAARRNIVTAPDPQLLAAQGIRRIARASEDPLPQPFASQVRSLTALRDTRYALLPIEYRSDPSRAPRGTVKLFLIDSRTARIVWVGEATGTTSDQLGPGESVAAKLSHAVAEKVADLVVAR